MADKTPKKPTVKRTGAKKLPPQYAVPKSDGDAPVQAWIDLIPEWQSIRARRIDAIVTRLVPNLHKAIKWHCVWYGVPNQGWFLAIGTFKAHLKLVFLDGALLTPIPPVPLKTKPNRALDIREADSFDEPQLAAWIKQASKLPGWGKA